MCAGGKTCCNRWAKVNASDYWVVERLTLATSG